MATGSGLVLRSDSGSDGDDSITEFPAGEPATQSDSSAGTSSSGKRSYCGSIFEFYTNPKEVSESVQAQCKLCLWPPGKKPVVIQGRIGVTSNFVRHMKVSLIAILVEIKNSIHVTCVKVCTACYSMCITVDYNYRVFLFFYVA